MTLPELKTALSGLPALDVIDFDMCLMGGYETLVAINGTAKFAVFSEEVEPGDGDDYTPVLQALYANPTMDGRTLATTIADKYGAFYTTSSASTTKSAYDLSGLAAFETALATVAQTLTTNISSLAPTIAVSAFKSQKFTTPMFTDIFDVIDSLSPAITDPAIKAQLATARTQAANSGFRLTNRTHNGSGYGANPVTKASGLSIVLPSGASADDWFTPAGSPLSLGAYQAAMPGKPWAQFLTAYTAQLTAPSANYVDQGANRWEIYLIWDSAAVSRNADLDLWVIEPNGNLYIPFLGTVTANGVLSSDSEKDRTYYEGYLTNRYVQSGRYFFYANLYTDPQNFRPAFDIVYRQGAAASFASLYAPTYPQMSKQTSWLNDPTPTFAEADAGSYTDLVFAAYLDVTGASFNRTTGSTWSMSSSRSVGATTSAPFRLSMASSSAVEPTLKYGASITSGAGATMTPAQMRTVRANWTGREKQRRAATSRSTYALPRIPASALKFVPQSPLSPPSAR